MRLSILLVTLHVLPSLTLLVKPQHTPSLIEEHEDQSGDKLIPWLARKQWLQRKHEMRVHMLADEPAEKQIESDVAVKDCVVCKGLQVVYGKYRSADGSALDNSLYLYKDPKVKDSTAYLPVAIQFHPGGFFAGGPWQVENDEIKAYLRKGFAVVSVGYRLATEKYFYEEDGDNKTEELIHVAKDGKLSLDKSGLTMEDYKVRIGKQEFITKYLYDATQMMDHVIQNADKFGLDMNRIVFIGESSGGAAMQYLTWVYHRWNKDRYTPRGMIYHNAQLNYPVNNMLSETWTLFSETMGPQVKLADVVSDEACPTIIGNHMCGSHLGNSSDYNLCNEKWNERSLREFCGEALKSATLGQAQARQVWRSKDKDAEETGEKEEKVEAAGKDKKAIKDDAEKTMAELQVKKGQKKAEPQVKGEAEEEGSDHDEGMEKLWYTSENMQQHKPCDRFYIYVVNHMNGTGAVDVAHHSLYALNFAKYAEMGDHGGHQYTVYYTDFAHMAPEDRGMRRVEVSRPATGLQLAPAPAGAAPPVPSAPSAVQPPASLVPPALAPAPAAAPGPAGPGFEIEAPTKTVFNYLSTHGWREDVAEARDSEAGSLEERVLYACLAVGNGPFAEIKNNTKHLESGALFSFPSLSVMMVTLLGLLSSGL